MKAKQTAPTQAQLHQDPDMDEFLKLMSDPWYRLNNLYHIINKEGDDVIFKCNDAQAEFYHNMHYRNIVLKSRQIGYSTLIDLLALDRALWNPNYIAGVIAHALPAAQQLFASKIKYPYEHLAPAVKAIAPKLVSDTMSSFIFDNGSQITVSTSFRSGTVNYLHVSELGAVAARTPERAKEIQSGALEALPVHGIGIIESTAEGQSGMFYDYCQRALILQEEGRPLHDQEWKMFFSPWHSHAENQQDLKTTITKEMAVYFAQLEAEGITLTDPQKWWYVQKEQNLGDLIFREHPSTHQECFMASMTGSYWGKQLSAARKDGRIGEVPHIPGIPVESWWDLGYNDSTSIWMTQTIGSSIHVIDYYENHGHGLVHYRDHLAAIARQRGFSYGTCYMPHDVAVVEFGTGVSRLQRAQDLGMTVQMIPRTQSKETVIESARMLFAFCRFDKEHCDQGLKHLGNYRRAWNDKLGTFGDQPVHDDSSHGADSFMAIAQAHPIASQMYTLSPDRMGDRTIHERLADPRGDAVIENSAGQIISRGAGFSKPSFLGDGGNRYPSVSDAELDHCGWDDM